ncbi:MULTISPECIES: HD domain-containing protein [Enterobacter cloacae complex]|uniref:HD domain-containing protein n=1 Tax=Enterobacter cloacae complex TaxID=354276 RepID=UPI000C1DE2FC|nr:HD domain-containing protein [Enterobacter roggenkampii]GMQ39834.1 HD domain-containing protein [Enterobacter asburiae]PJD14680.1 phosphohydrolase [Enterobacter roggenkampii]PJD15996.1 phosphohydrolase [Enterobacter roggenkampii]PJD21695.1 phosphohydrolase [Enterobacter roggenkampii]HDT5733301.1 HD domain-containing protein [Enterobacter roggenkampii]
MSLNITGISIPDTKMAREATEFIRDTESDLLFHHSSRVYYWGALAGQQRGLKVDQELLYVGCMFHDIGLTHEHCSCDKRFEVDGADAARSFLQGYGIDAADIDKVWTAIALHTTPGIPEFMAPEIALVTAGVEMDVLGIGYEKFSDDAIRLVTEQHPRPAAFKEEIIQAFYDGIKHRKQTTFGNVKADVIKDKEAGFTPLNFCSVIRQSRWKG